MVSPEEVAEWQSRNEEIAKLQPGYTDSFSLVSFRREEALKAKVVVQSGAPDSLIDAWCSSQITLPNIRPFIGKVQQFFQRATAIF